jgi:hypothetical protein
VHIKKASEKTQELNEYLTNPDEWIEEKIKKNNKKSDDEKSFSNAIVISNEVKNLFTLNNKSYVIR